MKKEKGLSFIAFVFIMIILITALIFLFLYVRDNLEEQYNNIQETTNSTDLLREYEEKTNITDINKNKTVTTSNNTVYSNAYLNIYSSDSTYLESSNSSANKYFYNQLNDTSKKIYKTIVNNIDSFKSGYGIIKFDINDGGVEDNFQSAWDAFELDNPQIFYIETKKIGLITKTTKSIFGNVSYTYQLQPKDEGNYFGDFWKTELDVQRSINQVDTIVDEVVNVAKTKTTQYEKIKYVHNYIVDNAHYDELNGINDNNVYGLLVEKAAVCEGYAKAFKMILDRMNIPCVIVYGNGISDDNSSEYHAWCYVKMEDNNWYAVDPTWDDPILIGMGTLSDTSRYRYFMRGSQNFSAKHISTGDVSGTGQDFKYPTLSETDYVVK